MLEQLLPAQVFAAFLVFARIGSAFPFHSHAAQLDRRLLSGLSRQAWDSTAEFLRARLTDAVIDSAVGHLPPEYGVLQGDALVALLRARRDALPRAAAHFYRLTAREVDVPVVPAAVPGE